MPLTCDLPPFLFKAVPSKADIDALASSNKINNGSLENYLRRLLEAVCTDLQNTSGVDRFIELVDVPNSYVGQALNYVRVNAAATGLEFFDLTPTLVTAFLQLSDAPHSYTGHGLEFVRVNVGETGLEFFDLSPTLVTVFTDLADVPNSYTGASLQAVRVDAAETGLEFFSQVFTLLGDVPSSYSGAADKIVKVNSAETGLEFSSVTIEDVDAIASLSRTLQAYTCNNSTGLGVYGVVAPTTRGTATVVRPSSGSPISGRLRLGFTSANNTHRYAFVIDGTGGGEVFRGNGAAEGGFRLTSVISVAATAVAANQRGFFGLQKALTAAPTDGVTTTQPSAYTDCVFLGYDGGETTLSIMHNDSAGTCTKVGLGASFPVDTTSMYRLRLTCPPNNSNIVYEVVNCGTGSIATGTLSSDLPTNTQNMQPWFFVSSGTTSAAVAFFMCSMVLEAYAY